MIEEVERILREKGDLIEKEIEKVVPRDGIRNLHDAIWYHLDSGGKRIRPVLAILTCESLGGDFRKVVPFAAACEILQQVHVRPTDRVVVLGDGKLGLLCAQALALTGCDLTAVGHHPEKLNVLARQGIPTATEDRPIEAGADLVVEATGRPEGYAMARRLVRPRGTVVLKSTYHGRVDADGSTELAKVLTMAVVDEVTLVGSRCGPFAPALRLLERGLVDVTALIHARYPLSEALTAFEHAARPGTLKVLVEMY